MIAVIGCGNPNRSDDGAGSEVIRLLRQSAALRERSDVRLLDAGTDGMAVMFAARGCAALIVVDSCSTGAAPATIYEVPGSEAESEHQPELNLHGFRWDHALYAGRKIYREDFPSDVVAYLIEARSLEFGTALSDDVAQAATAVVRKIEQSIASRAGSAAAPAVMSSSCVVSVRRGALHFSHDVYERFFNALQNVVLLRDQNDLVVLPVRHASAGGYVIKLRTAAGDRAVQAADFFRDNGIDDDIELTLPATWSDDRAALIAQNAFD